MPTLSAIFFSAVSFAFAPADEKERAEYESLRDLFSRATGVILERHENGEESKSLFAKAIEPATIARFLALSRDRKGDPEAVDAFIWISKFSPWPPSLPATAEAEEARRVLLERYVASPKLTVALQGAMATSSGSDAAETLYRVALDRSPHRDVRGAACYWLGRFLIEQADWTRLLNRPMSDWEDVPESRRPAAIAEKRWGEAARRLRGKDADGLVRQAEALFERGIREFADIPTGSGEDRVGEASGEELKAIRSLSIGQTAPRIEGLDVDGKSFRLTDYRGKVVVLTFSGEWCLPCRRMYPSERDLVERLKDRPFALLSVATDSKKETLVEAIAKREITWRCWWDGGTTGPICTSWHVASFPTVYVIDRRGIIRYKDLRDKSLDAAVDVLLAEPEG